MVHRGRRDADPSGRRRRPGRRSETGENGFTLVEVMAATVILVLVLVSLSNLLVDSLSVALVSKQREAAASLAGDMIENADALGVANLTAGSGVTPCSPIQTTAAVLPTRLTGASFQQCFVAFVDQYSYTVSPAVTVTSGTADGVTVTVTWSAGTYVTYSLVGS
jgi:prepilin-type N-terminal cleavage/methylation domain-containing protein